MRSLSKTTLLRIAIIILVDYLQSKSFIKKRRLDHDKVDL